MVVTLDFICFRLNMTEGHIEVLLHERNQAPHAGSLALIGGWVWERSGTHGDYYDRSLEDSVKRIIDSKVGVIPSYIEQIPVRGSMKRDPSLGWSVTIPHFCIFNHSDEPKSLPGSRAVWVPIHDVLSGMDLPFDHSELVATAYAAFINKSMYSSILLFLLPPVFIVADVVNAFQALDLNVSKQTVINRLIKTGVMVATGKQAEKAGPGKPAATYSVSGHEITYFNEIVGSKK